MASSDIDMLGYQEPNCCCCLTTAADAENLFDMKTLTFDYQQSLTITYFCAYQDISGCSPERLGQFPCETYMICQKCANQLVLAYAFRAQCISVMNELEQHYALKGLLMEQVTNAVDNDQLSSYQIKEEIDYPAQDFEDPIPTVIITCTNVEATPPAHRPIDVVEGQEKSCTQKAQYTCLECDVFFNSQKKFAHHIRFYHDQTRYQCPECNKQFLYGKQMWSHLLLHRTHNDTPFKCRECNFSTSYLEFLWQHLKNEHNLKYDESVYGYEESTRNERIAMIEKCKTKYTSKPRYIKVGQRRMPENTEITVKIEKTSPTIRRFPEKMNTYQNRCKNQKSVS
jgi:hypothetical protein